eukprot:scaffold258424_cov37-Tisochrysis_lutea.AAC.5
MPCASGDNAIPIGGIALGTRPRCVDTGAQNERTGRKAAACRLSSRCSTSPSIVRALSLARPKRRPPPEPVNSLLKVLPVLLPEPHRRWRDALGA